MGKNYNNSIIYENLSESSSSSENRSYEKGLYEIKVASLTKVVSAKFIY